MRGVFLQQQLEFRIEADGDQWCQGDSLPCSLTLKNHGAARGLDGLFLHLSCGNLKKIREKAPDALTLVAAAELDGAELESGSELRCPWSFELDQNCVVSDKGQTLCLECGIGATPAGHMPLAVKAHPHTAVVLSILQSNYSFVLKDQKTVGGWVKSKLKAPDARRFFNVEHLTLCSRFKADCLQLKYEFQVKKMDAMAASLKVKKRKIVVEQQLARSSYLFSEELVNHDPLEAAAAEAISEVESSI